MSVIFDITTCESSIKFLEEFLNIASETIYNFIKVNPNDIYVDDFIEINKIDLDSLNIEDVEAVVLHVTSNDDECQSIKKYGLMNLQQALAMDTPLKRHLKKHNIEFDISNNIMWVDSDALEITYDRSEERKNLKDVTRKIYCNFHIEGFFYIYDYSKYGGRVHERPEFLNDMNRLLRNKCLESDWKENNKHYVLKFKVPLGQFNYITFYPTKHQYQEDYGCKAILKKRLIKEALTIVRKTYCNETPETVFAYMKPEVIIPFSKCEIIR